MLNAHILSASFDAGKERKNPPEHQLSGGRKKDPLELAINNGSWVKSWQ